MSRDNEMKALLEQTSFRINDRLQHHRRSGMENDPSEARISCSTSKMT